jgi:exodeoxyribonuclease VII small subunit
MAPPTGETQRGFDEVLASLKQVVDRLESGQLSLEAALGAFEEGVRLAREGSQLLDAAERRVEILSQGEGGETTARPFEAPK